MKPRRGQSRLVAISAGDESWRQPRWQSTVSFSCRSAPRQLHKEIRTFGRFQDSGTSALILGWARMPIEVLHEAAAIDAATVPAIVAAGN
jgi:hypothetical protein